eukprot:TRINITY_DN3275_c0_g1_i1.p1 TRINITY_DN3275_c0_g1~~TRINITY_DN3275_c0_g1_i1.p1  ORF type:complete len:808 (+),score=126.14 TRINITY_DN3275_c0_g1_i1:99-2426(+)
MRTRHAESPLFGMMWFDASRLDGFEGMRHFCSEGDHLRKYGWLQHDGREYGRQQIIDSFVTLTTEFVKQPSNGTGGDWTLRVKGTPTPGAPSNAVSMLFYFTVPLSGSLELVNTKRTNKGISGSQSCIQLDGTTEQLGGFSFVMSDDPSNTPLPKVNGAIKIRNLPALKNTHLLRFLMNSEQTWQVEDVIKPHLRRSAQQLYQTVLQMVAKNKKNGRSVDRPTLPHLVPTLDNTVEADGNVWAFQKVLRAPFTLDIAFISHSSDEIKPAAPSKGKSSNSKKAVKGATIPAQLLNARTKAALTDTLLERKNSFSERFEQTFHLRDKMFSSDQVAFAEAVFSNLIGGTGYFSGRSIVVGPDNIKRETPPRELYSAVPSRSFFPRGFLWDEGFHHTLLQIWDADITREVWRHWLNLMEPSGWIPREQILGTEARSRVPEQFQAQNPIFANPPTFIFVFSKMLQRVIAANAADGDETEFVEVMDDDLEGDLFGATVQSDGQLAQEIAFLTNAFPLLQKNYDWFLQTQSGVVPGTFRWRGRTENHTLTSGLDDYPRAKMPNNNELHLDLLCWMILYADLMKDLCELAGEDATRYEEHARVFREKMDDVHWNEELQLHSDVALYQGGGGSPSFVQHVGYVSLFPFLLGLIPKDSDRLRVVLDVISDPEQLWAGCGIRSISIQDEYFGTGENYWKGPIWININYLAVASLFKNYITDGPHAAKAKQVYDLLRNGIIDNIYSEYESTGYVWEQYHPQTCRGQRSHPFTGWTALVVLLMAEIYP